MKSIKTLVAAAAISLLAFSNAHARVDAGDGGDSANTAQSQPAPKSDARMAAEKAAVMAARAAAGAAIGGAVGKAVVGSPLGAAAGVFITPSKIGCQAIRGC